MSDETTPGPDELRGAWVTCEHDVRIAAGPNPNNMQPTGKHPECFREYLAELMGLGEGDLPAVREFAARLDPRTESS